MGNSIVKNCRLSACPCFKNILCYYTKITEILMYFGMSALVLIMRLWMAKIFWYSGLTKISSWSSTIALFKYEYQVPVISPEIAAYFATAFELTCPILLVLGLGTRFATLPMLAMVAVIQFTYLDLINHFYWALMLGTILLYGPGVLSLDHFIKRCMCKK